MKFDVIRNRKEKLQTFSFKILPKIMTRQPKKVLFVIDSLQGSGAERSIAQIATNFKDYTPVFVHVYEGEMLKPDLEKRDIQVYSLNIKEKYGFNKAVELLTKIYRTEKPSLVHSTLFKSDMIARRLKKKFPDIPLIGSFVNNSYLPERYQNQGVVQRVKLWLAYQMDKQTARKVDFFISNSETIKKSEGDALGVPASKVKVIYRGRDFTTYTENQSEIELKKKKASLGIESKNILLNVSRLIERKAQLDIINALPVVLKEFPDTVLLVAGHGVYHQILEERARELGIDDRVKILGRRQDVPDLLELSKIFVYPSYAEGLPGALIEAMMAGKLIIASDIGENLECVDENSALIFKKGNIDELAEKVIYALRNFSDLQDLAINAKRIAREKFDIEKIAGQYENIYDQIAKIEKR